MHVLVEERPGGVSTLPVCRFALPIGGLCELYHRTGMDPEQLLQALAGDDELPEDEEDLLSGFKDIEKVEGHIKDILEVAFRHGGNPGLEFSREVGIFFELGRGFHLLSLAGRVLAAAAGSPKGDGFPLSKDQGDRGPPEAFKISAYFQLAGSLGIDPGSVMKMSLWEFSHYTYGKRLANGDETVRMGDAEADEVSKMLDEFEAGHNNANGSRETAIPPRG